MLQEEGRGKAGLDSAVTWVKFLKNCDYKDFGGDDIVHKGHPDEIILSRPSSMFLRKC